MITYNSYDNNEYSNFVTRFDSNNHSFRHISILKYVIQDQNKGIKTGYNDKTPIELL
jgi:hypothetical protein